jgi:hypothetical protein
MIDDGVLSLRTYNGSAYNSIFATVPSMLNKWSFICCTQTDGTTRSLFLNGSLLSSSSGGTNLYGLVVSQNFFLNAQAVGNGQNRFTGKISFATLYINKVLSNQEIQQNYNALKGRFGL